MRKFLPIAAALAISTSGAAYAQLKIDIKDNTKVTKVDVKAADLGKVKVMDNPAQTKVKVKVKPKI